MKTVYLAAWYRRRPEMLSIRDELQKMLIHVTSDWVYGFHEGIPQSQCAMDDIAGIEMANNMMVFTEKPEIGYYTGGRHVELGIAIALKKNIIIVGPRENVFYHLSNMVRVEDWQTAVKYLV